MRCSIVSLSWLVVWAASACAPPGDPRAGEPARVLRGLESEPGRDGRRVPKGESPDPYAPLQAWHYQEIRLPAAWAVEAGSDSTLIAVLDSGTWPHVDLDAQWEGGFDAVCGSDSVRATQRYPNAVLPGFYNHGLHVAGTIAAVRNNGQGGAGVCPGCKLLPVLTRGTITHAGCPAACSAPSGCPDVAMRDAITHAAGLASNGTVPPPARRADVINISLGQRMLQPNEPCPAEIVEKVDAAVAAGVTVVVAAGNYPSLGTPPPSSAFLWPRCAGDSAIVVAAASASGVLEPYSVRGPGITLTAPGGRPGQPNAFVGPYGDGAGARVDCTDAVADPSDQPTTGVFSAWAPATATGPSPPHVSCYRGWAGTSMAAPHVSGVVGLMQSRSRRLRGRPLRPAQVRELLVRTAQGGSCAALGECGAGMVDAEAAVLATTTAALLRADAAPFLDTAAGFSSTAAVQLHNDGVAPLTITRLELGGGGVFSFAGQGCTGTTCNTTLSVGADQATALTLRCTPGAGGPALLETSLTITSNSLRRPLVTVPLRCQRAGFAIEPAEVSFGDNRMGTPGPTQPLTLTNTSATSRSYNVRSLDRAQVVPSCTSGACECAEELAGLRCFGVLAPGSSATLTLTFGAGELGDRDGEVEVIFAGSPPALVGWTGRGVAPWLTVAINELTFGVVPYGESRTLPVTITNSGNAPLDVYPDLRADGVFTFASGAPTNLGENQSGTLLVRCSPSYGDTFGGVLALASNGIAPGGPPQLALRCDGGPPPESKPAAGSP